jgi:hypothetical protein
MPLALRWDLIHHAPAKEMEVFLDLHSSKDAVRMVERKLRSIFGPEHRREMRQSSSKTM